MAAEISEQFEDAGANLMHSEREIAEMLATLVDGYQVQRNEALSSVQHRLLENTDLDATSFFGGSNTSLDAGELDDSNVWGDMEIQVLQLWDVDHEAIAQKGLIGDHSGTTMFTAFTSSDLPRLEEGASYRLTNVVTDEYEGEYSVKLNSKTGIEPLGEDVEVAETVTTLEGALVAIQSPSGLIKRCPEDDCSRVVGSGSCPDHGDVAGEFDMRLKAVLDDGEDAHRVLFDQEATEAITGISMGEAKQQAMDALDTSVVEDRMRDLLVGRYYRAEARQTGSWYLVDEVEAFHENADVAALRAEASSLAEQLGSEMADAAA
ncbi:replication factor A [Halorubellus sp. PRR65]|uniref:replication factor A n=1 Tax=Halorubellus sp. PRR65 TaxID=3098148 RepID=UPI002B263B99|nr:replication factor A [Halorubellus sp. PRR65]